jgi:enoyl-CoA hydratase/carnithine racemase
MTSLLESARQEQVLHLTINRPEKRNALNAALCGELAGAIEAADRDPAVHAILLTANGKSFCAGMDLAEIGVTTDSAAIDDVQERLFTLGARITTPLVAAVHGAALAGGTGLVANCHVVVADPAATFGLTEVRIGLWPFLIFRACAVAMSERRTTELALTGRIVGAAEALSFGLVHEIAADAAARGAEIARQIAGYGPGAIRTGLAVVHDSNGLDWKATAERSRAARKQIFETAEFREGLSNWTKRDT